MTNEEIKATFLGQTVSMYDGWNGSREEFIVTDVYVQGMGVKLYGDMRGRNYEPCISVNRNVAEELIFTGKHMSHHELDHCPYDVTVKIIPSTEQVFQQRIDNIKADIKRLKQELKQAQTDYEHYLVSSIRIEVMRQNDETKK